MFEIINIFIDIFIYNCIDNSIFINKRFNRKSIGIIYTITYYIKIAIQILIVFLLYNKIDYIK